MLNLNNGGDQISQITAHQRQRVTSLEPSKSHAVDRNPPAGADRRTRDCDVVSTLTVVFVCDT